MDLNGHLLMIANTVRYDRDGYSSDSIKKLSKTTQVIFDSNSRRIREFEFEKNSLESEETWLGDGFYPKEEEFFNLIETD